MGKMKGFTLIEIVVVAGIMALFSLTLISVFLATIRSGSKAQLLQVGHQEGDFALKQMASVIREAKTVDCQSDSVTVTTILGSQINFALQTDGEIPRIASDSSRFLTGTATRASNLSFICYPGQLGNQVVTINFELNSQPGGQVQESFSQQFATSVSTRQY